MKAKKLILTIGLMLLPALPALSADGTFEGDVGATGVLANIGGNKAKFNEYRDITDGVYGDIRLKYDTDNFFLKGNAADMGYDTQRYHLDGGMYGKFKAYFEYTEIPHNFTFDARTFYSGAGTNNLTFIPPIPSVSTWKSFDYSTRRRTYQGGFSLDLMKPFFFDFSTSHEKKTGAYPIGVATGTSVSPGSSMVEIPQPIDYTTNTVNMTAGYAKNPFFAAVSFFYSDFDNAYSALFFDKPAGSPLGSSSVADAFSLPPDNQYYKLTFKGSAKLPLNSKFSVNLATGRATSDGNVVLASTTLPSTLGPIFHGKVKTDNYDFVLTSNPVPLLNAKIDFKYYDRKNKSDQLTIDSVTNDLLGYQKSKFGIDLGWNLPAKFYLDTAYSYVRTARQFRDDLPKTKDNIFSTELRWRGLDFMTPKVGYERLQRTAEHGQFDATDVEAYVWRFDAAPKDQDTVKASVDIYPFTNLNLSIGYKYKNADYKDTVLGLKSTKSDEINLDAGYTIGKIAQLNAYFDMELKKNFQFQRSFTTTANPSTQNSTNFNWDVTFKDNSYSWGAGSEIYLVPKTLTLLLQYDNVNSNGHADFSYLFSSALGGGRNNDNIDIGDWDDYRLSSYTAKIRYTPAKHYTFTAGYAYEHYKFNDAQFDNYQLVQGTNYLSGAYANPNYQAHVIFVAVAYRF